MRTASTQVAVSDLHIELVGDGFSFPTSLTFDEAGVAYLAESGLRFGGRLPVGESGASGRMAAARSY